MTDKRLLDMPPDKMEGEVVVALFFEDDRPLEGAAALLDWRLDGHLTQQLLDKAVTGALRDSILVQNNGKLVSDWVLLVGGGQRRKLTATVWTRLFSKIFKTCSQAGFSRISICVDADGSIPEDELVTLVSETFTTGNFSGIDYLLALVPVSAESGHVGS